MSSPSQGGSTRGGPRIATDSSTAGLQEKVLTCNCGSAANLLIHDSGSLVNHEEGCAKRLPHGVCKQ